MYWAVCSICSGPLILFSSLVVPIICIGFLLPIINIWNFLLIPFYLFLPFFLIKISSFHPVFLLSYYLLCLFDRSSELPQDVDMSLSHISETGKVTHGTGSAHARASQQPRLPEAPTRRAGSSTLNHSAILPGAPVVPQPGVPHPALCLPQGPFQTNCLQTPVPVCSERKACAELLDSFPVQPERTTKKSPSVATMPTCYPLVRVKVLGRARGYQLGGRRW